MRECPVTSQNCYNDKCVEGNCEFSDVGKRNTDAELISFLMGENVKLQEENDQLKKTRAFLQGLLDNHQ